MSSSFHQKTKKADPLGHGIVEAVFDIEGQENRQRLEQEEYQASLDARAREEAAAAEQLKTRQVDTRDQRHQAAADAAGATRSGNKGALTPRKRYAAKELLGE